MISSPFHLAQAMALMAATMMASQLWVRGEDSLTGPMPAPLQLQPAMVEMSPALVHHFGEQTMRAPDPVLDALWHPGGDLFLVSLLGGYHEHQIGLWKRTPGKEQLTLEGYLGMEAPWALSPDGTLIFGTSMITRNQRGVVGCFRFADRQPLWSLRSGALNDIRSAAFSPDAKLLAVLSVTQENCMVTLLDAVSGRKLKECQLDMSPDHARRVRGALAFVHDGLLLNPGLDREGRLTVLDLKSWAPAPVQNSKSTYWGGTRLVVSKDDRWVVAWDRNTYVVFDHSGRGFREKFRGSADTFEFQTGGFHSVALSPDGRSLVVSGNGRHRVFELATQKAIHVSDQYCMCGQFHPDGKTFWRTCTPFVPVKTDQWSSGNADQLGHFSSLEALAESPDGKWLAVQNQEAILVWPVNGTTPAFSLRPVHEDECWNLQNMVWSADSKTVYAGDSWNFLKWNIPATAPAGEVVKIPGTIAFEDRPRRPNDYAAKQGILVDHAGKWCLLRSATARHSLRSLERADLVQTLAIEQAKNNLFSKYWFAKDDKTLVTAGNFIGITLYDIASHSTRTVTLEKRGSVEGLVDARDWLISLTDNGKTLTFSRVDDGKVQLQFPFPTQSTFGFGSHYAVSPDGRWVATVFQNFDHPDREGVALYDLEKRRLAAFLPLEHGSGRGTLPTFSSDGARLYTGRSSGAVQVWDVAKLEQSAPPSADWLKGELAAGQPQAAVATRASGSNSTYKPIPWEASLPTKPVKMEESSVWTFQPDGSASAGDDFPSIGRLTLGGKTLTSQGAESMTSSNGQYFSGSTMLRSQDGTLQVRREIMGNRGWGGDVVFVDHVVNTTSQPVETDFAFEAAPGLEAAALRNEDNEPLRLEGSEIVPSPNMFLVGGEKIEKDGRGRARYFQFLTGPTPPVTPVLQWNASRQAVVAVHHLKLPPLSTRIFLHAGNTRLLPPELSCKTFFQGKLHHLNSANTLVERLFMPQVMALAANYSEDLEWKKKMILPFRPKTSTVNYSAPVKDSSGFSWTSPMAPRGFSNELGVARGMEPWIDGAPAFFSALISQPGKASPTLANTNATRTVLQKGDYSLRAGSSAMLVMTFVTNNTEAPLHSKISLHTYLTGPASVFCDAKGTELPRSKSIPAAQYGGKLLLTLPGANQPSQIFSVCGERAKLKPFVRLVDDRVLALDYEIDFTAGQTVTLLHGVAQRPGAAFGTAVNTMADWKDLDDLQKARRMPPGAQPGTQLVPVFPEAANWNP